MKPRSVSLEGEILDALIMGGENILAQQCNDAVGARDGGLHSLWKRADLKRVRLFYYSEQSRTEERLSSLPAIGG